MCAGGVRATHIYAQKAIRPNYQLSLPPNYERLPKVSRPQHTDGKKVIKYATENSGASCSNVTAMAGRVVLRGPAWTLLQSSRWCLGTSPCQRWENSMWCTFSPNPRIPRRIRPSQTPVGRMPASACSTAMKKMNKGVKLRRLIDFSQTTLAELANVTHSLSLITTKSQRSQRHTEKASR